MRQPAPLWLVFVVGTILAVNQNRALPEAQAQTAAVTHYKVVSAAFLDRHWSGSRAMKGIAAQLTYTPRALGTVGHLKTIKFIKRELAKGARALVKQQEWTYHDENGTSFQLTNVIARFQPSNPRRIIIGTHYDSIVRAYRDSENPLAPMPGANNSASGVAVLLEIARSLSLLPPPPIGVDLVFFDGEEGPKALGAGDPEWRPLGSPYFVSHLKELYPQEDPEQAMILDMVCYRNLKLKPELSSLWSAQHQVDEFWAIGKNVSSTIFVSTPTSEPISDDHTALASVGVPSFLVIDFDYDPWFNTTKDTIDKCSTESLNAVGHTILRYVYTVK
jgi:glutaminyl-peptide cyclotransferase